MNIINKKYNSIKLVSSVLLILSLGVSAAQDAKTEQEKGAGFYYGFGLGAFKANNASAEYYLERASNPYSYEQQLWNDNFIERIELELDDELVLDADGRPYLEFPYPIRYKTTVAGTLLGGYDFGKGLSVVANLTYTRLKANTYFKLFVNSPVEKNAYDNSVKCIISGEESRVQIDLGAHQSFIRPKGLRPFIEGGACLAVTEVTKHVMAIGNLQIPFSYAEGTTSTQNSSDTTAYSSSYSSSGASSATTTNAVQPGGASLGVFISAGIDFPYNDKFKGSIGGGSAIYRVPLKEGSPYLAHFNLFFRVIVM